MYALLYKMYTVHDVSSWERRVLPAVANPTRQVYAPAGGGLGPHPDRTEAEEEELVGGSVPQCPTLAGVGMVVVV